MLLRILTFQLFFAGIWAAIIPDQSKEAPALSFKDKLCSKVAPTLNISEVCSPTLEPQNDSPDSLLRFDSKSLCDHAAYLVQKLCKVALSVPSNLTKTLETNMTALFSTKYLQFCPRMVQIQKELGYANSSDTNDTNQNVLVKCVLLCLNKDKNSIEPLCNFILWSWTYIENNTKALETSNMPSPSNPDTSGKINSDHIQETIKPSTIPQQLPSSNIGAPNPEPPQSVDPAKAVGNSEPLGKTNNPVEDKTVNDKGANSEPEDPNLGKETKHIDQPSMQMNEPPGLAGEEKTNEAATERQDILNRNPIPAKAEEDENLAREGDINEESRDEMEDQAGNNLEPPLHGKLLPNDKKDVPGTAKNLKNDFSLDAGDNGDGEDADDEEEPQLKRKKEPFPQSHERMSNVDDDIKKEDLSHFSFLFFVAMCVCIVLYLIYQNKRKIIAMALEGKKGRHSGRRRPTSASYQKLDNKLDEVMASSPPPSKTHVIY